MPVAAILFDLDDTLIVDHPVSRHALLDTGWLAAQVRALDAAALAGAAEEIANERWKKLPTWAYCERIGHSALEGLWARYDNGAHPEIKTLRAQARAYRLAVWHDALAEQGLRDEVLAEELADHFIEVRKRYPRWPEIDRVLKALIGKYKLGVVTNGAPDLQHDKLNGSGLSRIFQAVAVSGEIDSGKPERGIFEWVCKKLEVAPEQCVMVGDNPLRDVKGGREMGMKTVLCTRGLRKPEPKVPADLTVGTLAEMLPWLEKQ